LRMKYSLICVMPWAYSGTMCLNFDTLRQDKKAFVKQVFILES
jgi:hypothetical protein